MKDDVDISRGKMTTVQSRVREISNREGFDITVTRKGKEVRLRSNGVLGPWSYRRKTKDSATVADFRAKFEAVYPGYCCIVETGLGR
jgi:hypothetical protein